jgi:hypothetical protein
MGLPKCAFDVLMRTAGERAISRPPEEMAYVSHWTTSGELCPTCLLTSYMVHSLRSAGPLQQASSMRRVEIRGRDLSLTDFCTGESIDVFGPSLDKLKRNPLLCSVSVRWSELRE